MSTPKGLDAQIVRRDEKLSRMMEFLRISFPQARSEDPEARTTIDMIARSAASPVLRATVATVLEADYPMVAVRIILAERPDTISESLSMLAPTIRYMPTSRLFDVHEQLVIGDSGAWIGDSMRRDPLKLDAYERFLTADAEATAWATLAFDRLWSIARPAETRAFKVILDDAVTPNVTPATAGTPITGDSTDLTGN